MHYPAHESLQEYAKRIGQSPKEAYAAWHNRPYPKFSIRKVDEKGEHVETYEHMGPGLGLTQLP